ncbi:MAG: cytochrome d ubiquinol oxidase, subunit [Bradyrhizobium sp.]|nr:cytochrome d ubiquinol oxidase, subunit [Bradyrhizobium sp.]
MKATGTTAYFGRAAARFALPATLTFIAIVSIWTPLAYPHIADRWFSWPNIAYLSPVPIVTAGVAYGEYRAITGSRERLPFLLAIALFLLAFLGLSISLWPYAVPYVATLWQAASSRATLAFVGIGTAIIVPIVLGYFGFAYWGCFEARSRARRATTIRVNQPRQTYHRGRPIRERRGRPQQ